MADDINVSGIFDNMHWANQRIGKKVNRLSRKMAKEIASTGKRIAKAVKATG